MPDSFVDQPVRSTEGEGDALHSLAFQLLDGEEAPIPELAIVPSPAILDADPVLPEHEEPGIAAMAEPSTERGLEQAEDAPARGESHAD